MPGHKQPSGAQNRRKAKERAAELRESQGLDPAIAALPPVPADDLELQAWGARYAATLCWLVITSPSALSPEQWRQANQFLGTLGMLFPRALLAKRGIAELNRRHGKAEDDMTKPIDGVDPGPTSRFRGGAKGRGSTAS